ncbi:HAMP domain-containing sensor histidine kinase [Mucilaginibacter sp. dw_454]|uniref:sensor histidine kinase n=1 Tax=Mucilaginibacter sp. dw_454 TaxID=2720079 RepID=UPI001BD3FD1A|nr:HAMP domain-containing sensor histidine kinase [Mucilaginibacter sp. dw_454]
MKRRFKIIAWLAAVTVLGILVFQVYWVYNTYKTGERNFNTTVLNALYKSIDKYPLSVSKLPYGLQSKTPYLPLINLIHQSNPAASKYKSITGDAVTVKKSDQVFSGNSVSLLPVSSDNLLAVQQLVAQLLTEQDGKPIILDTLTRLFKKELLEKEIKLPFKLTLLKPHEHASPRQIASNVPFTKDDRLVAVEMAHTFQFLLSQNIMPALVSLLLIILSGGSLIYMGLIINRQMQLDGLKNDFINNITHELRTPIAILRSSSESLLKFGDLKDTEKTIRHLNINLDILDKLDKNVDRILDITRYEHGIKSINYELIHIDQLIEGILGRFSINNELAVHYQSELTNKLVTTDAYIIDTVISNLVDNAIKYAERPPEISIITSSLSGDGWQLQVIDNGIGISDQNIPYIFDKFYRVGSGNLHNVKGYGLGLSYVKQLVTSLNGSISAKSKLGAGTEFIIKFPAHE